MFIQKNIPPPNKVLNFTVSNFAGGLNNRSTQLLDNQASDVINMKFDDETLMSKRDGVAFYDALTLSSPVTHMNEYEPYNLPAIVIRASNTEIYAGSTKICNVAGKVCGRNYMGKYFFVDGAKIRVYGIFPQTANTHTKIVGTPVATNTVLELVTPPANTPLANPETSGVWAYDYTAGKCWYEPCAYEISDTYKGANVIPTNPSFIEVHGERLFVAGSTADINNVFISDIANGFYSPVFLPIQLPPNSDKIKGLAVFSDAIIVGRQLDVHVIYGNTNRTSLSSELFKLKKINTHTGFASNDAVNIVNNFLFYLGHDGVVYAMHTVKTDVDNLATTIISKTLDFLKAPISATIADYANAQSVYFHEEWYLSIADKVMVFSYRHQAFTMYKYASMNPTCLYFKDYTLFIGTNGGRIITPTPNVYKDINLPYASYWKSKSMDFGDITTFKQFREFYIVANIFEQYTSTVNFKFEVDNIDINQIYTLTNQASIYGKTKWGERFINRNIIASTPVIIGRRGRTLKFRLQNGYFINATVALYTDLVYLGGIFEGFLAYVSGEDKYYLFSNQQWIEQTDEDLYQPMKVFEVSGQYELRGKR